MTIPPKFSCHRQDTHTIAVVADRVLTAHETSVITSRLLEALNAPLTPEQTLEQTPTFLSTDEITAILQNKCLHCEGGCAMAGMDTYYCARLAWPENFDT